MAVDFKDASQDSRRRPKGGRQDDQVRLSQAREKVRTSPKAKNQATASRKSTKPTRSSPIRRSAVGTTRSGRTGSATPRPHPAAWRRVPGRVRRRPRRRRGLLEFFRSIFGGDLSGRGGPRRRGCPSRIYSRAGVGVAAATCRRASKSARRGIPGGPEDVHDGRRGAVRDATAPDTAGRQPCTAWRRWLAARSPTGRREDSHGV